jgi:hypothetical protein
MARLVHSAHAKDDVVLGDGSVKVSRWTSRQPPHSLEICSNWAAIQSAAALAPWHGGKSFSMLESVLRVPKPASD